MVQFSASAVSTSSHYSSIIRTVSTFRTYDDFIIFVKKNKYIIISFLIITIITITHSSSPRNYNENYVSLIVRDIINEENNNNNDDNNEVDDDNNDNNDSMEYNFAENSVQMKKWRKSMQEQCQNSLANNNDDVRRNLREVLNHNKMKDNLLPKSWLQYKDYSKNKRNVDHTTFRRCPYVILDFGANIGDTSSHVIDSGMIIPCDYTANHRTRQTKPLIHFDVVNATTETPHFIMTPTKYNVFSKHIAELINIHSQRIGNKTKNSDITLGPEDYCYYGIEGNPVFTERLKNIERTVMNDMQPRPVGRLQFLTQSIGAGAVGPATLYLDTINTAENFWGSSIFVNHQDVRKSIEQNGTSTVAVNVTGYTISSLMKQTLSAYDDPKDQQHSDDDILQNHLIIKVDIEGGEYPLLEEAIQNGTLCSFVNETKHVVDFYIEFHSHRVTGNREFGFHKRKSMMKTLQECGITFRHLAAFWA